MEEHVTTEQLLDLAAFIKKAAENPLIKNDDVLANVQHDLEGFVLKKHDKFWVPRTKGWNKH